MCKKSAQGESPWYGSTAITFSTVRSEGESCASLVGGVHDAANKFFAFAKTVHAN